MIDPMRRHVPITVPSTVSVCEKAEDANQSADAAAVISSFLKPIVREDCVAKLEMVRGKRANSNANAGGQQTIARSWHTPCLLCIRTVLTLQEVIRFCWAASLVIQAGLRGLAFVSSYMHLAAFVAMRRSAGSLFSPSRMALCPTGGRNATLSIYSGDAHVILTGGRLLFYPGPHPEPLSPASVGPKWSGVR